MPDFVSRMIIARETDAETVGVDSFIIGTKRHGRWIGVFVQIFKSRSLPGAFIGSFSTPLYGSILFGNRMGEHGFVFEGRQENAFSPDDR